jgi:hypothetical protein
MVSERLTAAAKRAESHCETQNETGFDSLRARGPIQSLGKPSLGDTRPQIS